MDNDEITLPPIGSIKTYNQLMKVIKNRITVRKFDENFKIPDKHYELIIEAARHAPSGANSQPWHFIVHSLSIVVICYLVEKKYY